MRYFSVLSVLTMTCVAGCGGGGPQDMPEVGAVTGVVTVDGAPGAGVVVTFQPEGGRPSMGTTSSDGKYELTYSRSAMGAKIGKNLVTISTNVTDENYEEGSEEGVGGEEEEAQDPTIPAKYNTMALENPDMTVDVKAGENTFNFDVTTAAE